MQTKLERSKRRLELLKALRAAKLAYRANESDENYERLIIAYRELLMKYISHVGSARGN